MAASPRLKIYDWDKTYIASFHFVKDAAEFIGTKLGGATVRYGHRVCDTVWTMGGEGDVIHNPFECARIIRKRIDEREAE